MVILESTSLDAAFEVCPAHMITVLADWTAIPELISGWTVELLPAAR